MKATAHASPASINRIGYPARGKGVQTRGSDSDFLRSSSSRPSLLKTQRGLDRDRAGALIRFRFRTTVLVGHPVFVEQFLHLIRDHVPIVWNGNKRNLLPRFGGWFSRRILSLWPGCIRIRHRNSIHESGMDYILLKGL